MSNIRPMGTDVRSCGAVRNRIGKWEGKEQDKKKKKELDKI